MSPLAWVLLGASAAWVIAGLVVAVFLGGTIRNRDKQKPSGPVDVYVRAEDVVPLHITTRPLSDSVNVDYDHNGLVVGVEVLDARAVEINGRNEETK